MRHHTLSARLRTPKFLPTTYSTARRMSQVVGLVAAATIALAGCATPTPTTGADHTEQPLTHVHGIVADPAGEGFLLGTHEGVYPATDDGDLGPRIKGSDFDAMGLTVLDGELLASGHPGRSTPEELGAPNLGIIRSADRAETWQPIAFTGEKDFHALTAAPDGTVYALATDSSEILISVDRGVTWNPTGASLFALGFAVDATGRLIASTPDGLQVSTDNGETFTPWLDAPALFALSSSPDHQRLVGIGSGGRIWTTTADATAWTDVGTTHGTAQAIAITDVGDMIVVDDSGITMVPNP